MGAMIGAMFVLVVGVLAFVLLRDLNRESAETEPEAIEWQTAVVAAQDAGYRIAYPAELPEGWKVTSLDFTPTDPPAWGLGMLTDTGAFVGIRQEDERVQDLLEVYVDDQATEEEPTEIEGELGGPWERWTDSGGDVALVRPRDGDVVMVYGSASEEVVEQVAASLTEKKLTELDRSEPVAE